jgi:hypothetical protein
MGTGGEIFDRRKIRCERDAGKVDGAGPRWEVARTPGAGENACDADAARSALDPNPAIGP